MPVPAARLMRAYLPAFALRRAESLGDALELLAREPGAWRPFAGGTDLMVLLAAGELAHRRFVSIRGLPQLRRVEGDASGVYIGALTTFTDIRRHPLIRAEYPSLAAAAAETGGAANQNRGTIGGNIANASPAADSPPALLAAGAEIELLSVRGSRRLPYDRFHTGYKAMDLAADEVIGGLYLPRLGGWIHHYRKVGARRAQAISKISFCGAARLEGGRIAEVRLALGSVAPTVVRARGAEAALAGQSPGGAPWDRIEDALVRDIHPIDDDRSSERYRRRVAAALLREFVERLTREADGRDRPPT